jgi:hypothetical protein
VTHGRMSDAEQERADLGLTDRQREQLAGALTKITAPADLGPLWSRVLAARRPRGRSGARLLQIGFWQMVATPARLLVPGLTALLIVGAEWLSLWLSHRDIGITVWALAAPWLGVWALAAPSDRGGGALSVLSATAPVTRGQRLIARWVGGAATGAVSIVVALMLGADLGPRAGQADLAQWAVMAAVGFAAALAAGLLGAALVTPRLSNAWVLGVGAANTAWVGCALGLGHASWLPSLLLLHAPVATAAGIVTAAWVSGRLLTRQWRAG